jgi:ribosome-interacting GTPase 1
LTAFLISRRKDKGPVNFQAMVPQSILSKEIVFAICREYKITSADIFCKCDATIDQLIDVIEGNRRYIPVCLHHLQLYLNPSGD